MKNTAAQKRTAVKSAAAIIGRQRSYSEVVELLDANWKVPVDPTLARMKQLDAALASVAQQVNTIFVSGTNGKSLTAHFMSKLLREEGLSVGVLYSPHILTYNERLYFNNEIISNKAFTDLANEVIGAAESIDINPHSLEILTMMALVHSKNNNIDVVVVETNLDAAHDPAYICAPHIIAITRITDPDIVQQSEAETKSLMKNIITMVKKGTHVVSADQSKLSLQVMQTIVEERSGTWVMPIRKLAPLSYPFEQLHGRCASLAERVCYTYVNNFANKDSLLFTKSLLSKQKGQRGRPTLEAKRLSALNPRMTISQFWKDANNTLAGRFQLLDKEKPTILLDNASNLDALKNVLLGARLLHYQRPLKGASIILGCTGNSMNQYELLKTLRYFFKKTSGTIILCPVDPLVSAAQEVPTEPWDIEYLTNEIKAMKIKAKACKNLKDALAFARETVDERSGLVIVTGSTAVVAQYWQEKGIKRL